MAEKENNYALNNLSAIQVSLASAEKIREWSKGEVTKPETINYKTHKPEKGGLFCEAIFGPKKDNECYCGKYKKSKYKNITCPTCGVEVTTSKVRRIRMGHIELVTPIAHIWYYKGIPSRMSLVLDIPQKSLEEILAYAKYVMVGDQTITYVDPEAPGGTSTKELKKYDVITIQEYAVLQRSTRAKIKAEMGGEAILRLLEDLTPDELDKIAATLRTKIDDIRNKDIAKDKPSPTDQQEIARYSKRLDTIEMFRKSGTAPKDMMLTVLPVIPPDLRPLLQLEGGRFGTSDLTEFYRKIIYRNNTLKKHIQCGAPSLIINQQKRMLQTAVDALFENSKRAKPFTGSGNRPLKSLSDMLRGKQGRFRQNLLGKRVDYSGRSVIVVGPELKIYQCGVPKEMALELFKPFVVRKLFADYGKEDLNTEIKAEKAIEAGTDSRVWSALEKVIKQHPVLLNRAPTLHRLGIQAFEPVLVEGKALKLHPLVCTAFNADFDGDQMAIHIPLSIEAQTEARFLMLSVNNLLAPKDGKPITVPTQDMVLGSYYLTITESDDYTDAPLYKNANEAKIAYELGLIKIHTPIIVKKEGMWNGEKVTQILKTTIGRIIFNDAIPQDIGFVDRTKRENALSLEIDTIVKKGTLGVIIDKCIKKHGLTKSAVVIDDIKALGYKFSTKGALTVSVADITIPDIKEKMVKEAEEKVEDLYEKYLEGTLTEEGRYNQVIKIWNDTTDGLASILQKSMDKFNPICMMADSGARGSINQIKQLAGMRGVMSSTSGKAIEIPIKSNFREGLNIIEFFISSHGTRKTLSDTALRTADSGYLTRRLVYASQDVVIRERDCGTHRGIDFVEIVSSDDPSKAIVPLADRIRGRYPSDDIIDPATGEIIANRDTLIDDETIAKINAAGIKKVRVRSVIECASKYGVCAKCYGSNLATNNVCSIGEVVGIIAAQSIGEPGTQLTMRTFHTGGVATADDITQGLPRVEELFEARKPKGVAVIADISGTVEIINEGKANGAIKVVITSDDGEKSEKECIMSQLAKVPGTQNLIATGCRLNAGDAITNGPKDPHDVMRVLGDVAVENYIIEEVQKVYNSQSVKINDRHLEVIVRQMLRKVKVLDAGETDLIAGNIINLAEFDEINAKAELNGKQKAKGERLLLGITKAVLNSDSFLSAASFQETTKVLTDAAIRQKRDSLKGLKENILVGKLIPAGTGLDRYTSINVDGPVPDCVKEILAAKELYDEAHKNDKAAIDAASEASEDEFLGGAEDTILSDEEALAEGEGFDFGDEGLRLGLDIEDEENMSDDMIDASLSGDYEDQE